MSRRWFRFTRGAASDDPYKVVHATRVARAALPSRSINVSFDEYDEIIGMRIWHYESDKIVEMDTKIDGTYLSPSTSDWAESITEESQSGGLFVESTKDTGESLEIPKGKIVQSGLQVWDTLDWDDHLDPYVHGHFNLRMKFTATEPFTVVTVDIPKSHRPSVIRGNYHFAHPSQQKGDRRRVRVLFFDRNQMRLQMGITRMQGTISIWAVQTRAILLVAFGLLLSYLGSGASSGDLLLSTILGLGAFGITQASFFNSAIYSERRRPLQIVGLTAVLVSVLAYACIAIGLLRSDAGLWWTRPFGFAVMGVTIAWTIVGLVLHRHGVFGGFACDLCGSPIRWRRGQSECYVTGRVPCQVDVERVCATCPHFADLGAAKLTTLEGYDPTRIPCANLDDDC